MSEDFSWIPGTVALAVGLLVGLWAAFRLKRVAPSTGAKSDLNSLEQDLQLEIADLTARRDDLYARLRGEGEDEELEADEVRVLEQSAARTLRDLDRAGMALSKIRPEKSPKKSTASKDPVSSKAVSATAVPATAVPATAGAPPVQHHPFLWFLLGAGLMGLVGFLVFWADRDAKPDPMATQNMASGRPPEAGMPADHPGGAQGLAPDIQAQVTALEADVEANPGNMAARKQLAVLLAQNQQYFEAFKHSEEILRESPDDMDALYISGVVRLAMGQSEDAVSLLDRVIAQFPGHVLAHLGRGAAMLRLERRDEALASWRAGLQAAGGSNPAIEDMIAQEFGAAVLEGGAPVVPSAAPTTPAPRPASPAPASPSPAETGEPKIYRVFIELAAGTQVPAGASLFVSVHNAGGGPPAAVRRIGDPKFPLEVTLTQDNSMTGIALPARGMVMISLDSDGHPGTQSESDLSARGEATSGELAKFVLW